MSVRVYGRKKKGLINMFLNNTNDNDSESGWGILIVIIIAIIICIGIEKKAQKNFDLIIDEYVETKSELFEKMEVNHNTLTMLDESGELEYYDLDSLEDEFDGLDGLLLKITGTDVSRNSG